MKRRVLSAVLQILSFALAVLVHCGGASAEDDQAATARELVADRLAQAKRLAYQQHALVHAGDPERGRALYRKDQVTRCNVCHRIDNQGGTVGPDLTRVGGKFDRPHLIESLLDPSRQIVEGYRTAVIATVAGEAVTGIIKEESQDRLALLDENGKQHVIAKDEIDTRHENAVSLMPAGLADQLTLQEFTDLIAYLETLRPGDPKMGAGTSGPIKLPRDFTIKTVVTHLTGCTALEALPDGRVLVCEQTGKLRVLKDGKLLEEPLVTLPVDDTWERGLIGVTVHPDFPAEPYVYVCYVAKEPYPHHRVSRFTVEGDVAAPGSEALLLSGDDQRTLGGNVPAGHQGGAVHFGTDGMLYIAIGEHTAKTPSQDLHSFQGKILRLHPDGTIPRDNPFVDRTEGKYAAIWAMGLRNPFTFAVHAPSGDLFINDVGGKFEEINRGVRGGNYGWPVVDHGPTQDPRFVAPIHIYPQSSINGGDFAPDTWPGEFRGRYFFADFVQGWIKTLAPEDPEDVTTFATGLRRPVDLRFAPDGSLYVLLRNAWVIDDKFQPHTGSLLAIRPRPEDHR